MFKLYFICLQFYNASYSQLIYIHTRYLVLYLMKLVDSCIYHFQSIVFRDCRVIEGVPPCQPSLQELLRNLFD